MVWARLDDQFHSHPKLAELKTDLMLPAAGLHTLVLSWCASQLTDGYVPGGQVRRLAGQPVEKLTRELVRVGLWEPADGGYQIHDYLDYNPSKAQVMAERKRKSEGGRRGGLASGRARREASAEADAEAYAQAYAEGSAGQMLHDPFAKRSGGSGTPVPVPYIPEDKSSGASTSDAPVENSPGDPDEFAGIDFGEDGSSSEQGPDPPEDNHTDGQKLVALYVDTRSQVGSKPTKRQIGIVAQIVGEKLEGGAKPDVMESAIRAMVKDGKPVNALPNLIDQFEASRRSRPAASDLPEDNMTPEQRKASWEAFRKTPEGQKFAKLAGGVAGDMP
ncbi:MAG: hypothetical protein JXA57_17820 [Armatimonadetes bacterium]|nr:hypothetical protein [Armatimonadota bacterium]